MTSTSAAAPQRKFTPDERSNIPLYDFLETGLVPEWLIRMGIRNMLRTKLNEHTSDIEQEMQTHMQFVNELKRSPIAIATDSANEQHYELPPQFFKLVLGPHVKYSSGYWNRNTRILGEAEANMLALTCERAQIADGQTVLDLGCGWGAFSLYAAQRFPNSQFVALSNSSPQRQHIEKRAKEIGLTNLRIVTGDISTIPEMFWQSEADVASGAQFRGFDRVVSVEMFEHMKNYEALLKKIAGWMSPSGKLFVHIFTHRHFAYHFDSKDPNDWLTKYFFTGGTMPSDTLLLYFQNDMKIADHWLVSGQHYQKTAEAWLKNMQSHKPEILKIFSQTYGEQQTQRWWLYWRMFFLACAELWGYSNGREWLVSHYLFEKR